MAVFTPFMISDFEDCSDYKADWMVFTGYVLREKVNYYTVHSGSSIILSLRRFLMQLPYFSCLSEITES